MTIDNSVNQQAGPFIQFEKCGKPEIQCKYKNESGDCIYEICIYDSEHPPTIKLMSYKCMVCDEVGMRDPREMKIRICDDCLRRMLAAEKKPFNCVFCGGSQGHNSKIFLSGICDECFTKINRSIHCVKCGNA